MIRQSNAADVGPVCTLIEAAYRDYVTLLGRNPQPLDDDYGQLINAGEVFVLERNGHIDGAIVLQEVDNELLVRTVAVDPASQRQGLGTLMMEYAASYAQDRGIATLRLYTNEVMAGNVELYRRLGYGETNRAGPTGRQIVHMAIQLDPTSTRAASERAVQKARTNG